MDMNVIYMFELFLQVGKMEIAGGISVYQMVILVLLIIIVINGVQGFLERNQN